MSVGLINRRIYKMRGGREKRVSHTFLHIPTRVLLADGMGIVEPEVVDVPDPDWPADSGQRQVQVHCRKTGVWASDLEILNRSTAVGGRCFGDSRFRFLVIGKKRWSPKKSCFTQQGYVSLLPDGQLDADFMTRLLDGAIELPIQED